jgi:anti-sigma factor RsiW
MFCESWRETLGATAISGEALPREAQAHLAGCASCRAALTDQQQFFALMDSGLRSVANVETPPSLLPKVRAQIAEPRPAKTRWIPVLSFAATAIALIAVTTFSLSRAARTKEQSPTASVGAPQTLLPPANPPGVQPVSAAEEPVKKGTAPPSTAVSRPGRDIIVSADEQTSLQIYLSAFRARASNSAALVTVKTEPAAQIKPLEISEIEMPQLTIEQLQGGESK